MLYYEGRGAARPGFNGRCAPLVSTEALWPPGFIRGRRPLVSSQPLAASWIVLAKGRFYKLACDVFAAIVP